MKNCWKCKKQIDEQDNFCRYCGAGSKAPWHYTWWGIFLLTFCLGPLALPYVIRSPLLGRKEKWLWSVLIIIFTLFLLLLIYLTFKELSDLLNAAMNGNLDPAAFWHLP